MGIEIRKLTPDLAEDYVHFFDVTPHDEKKDENKCYCVVWRGDATYKGDDHWFPTREERRERALEFIRGGFIQGYLAYEDGKIIGWCNATDDCKNGVKYLSSYWQIDASADVKVKSIFCFVIAPEMQRKGVATQLTERVCRDAADDGYDFVEAYTNETHAPLDFSGPLAMYEKCGFERCGKKDGRVTVRKSLK
jgi:Sortase and related acyltransferases